MAVISAERGWQRAARAFTVRRHTYAGSAICPEGRVRCRAVISAVAPSARYFARSLSGAESGSPLIRLMAAVRALTADVRAARGTRRHSNGAVFGFRDRGRQAVNY